MLYVVAFALIGSRRSHRRVNDINLSTQSPAACQQRSASARSQVHYAVMLVRTGSHRIPFVTVLALRRSRLIVDQGRTTCDQYPPAKTTSWRLPPTVWLLGHSARSSSRLLGPDYPALYLSAIKPVWVLKAKDAPRRSAFSLARSSSSSVQHYEPPYCRHGDRPATTLILRSARGSQRRTGEIPGDAGELSRASDREALQTAC